jgi:hypothetical protein
LNLEGQEPVTAQLTRDEAQQLEVSPGDIVWLRSTSSAPVSA